MENNKFEINLKSCANSKVGPEAQLYNFYCLD